MLSVYCLHQIDQTRLVLRDIVLAEEVTVPLGAHNRDTIFVVPSDNPWSGGPLYIAHIGMQLRDVPPAAICQSSYGRYDSSPPNYFTFDCAWQVGSDWHRAYVDFPLVSGDVAEWHFVQSELKLVPVMRSWWSVNNSALHRLWWHGLGFLFCVIVLSSIIMLSRGSKESA
jgi:hypothetical protein